MIAAYGAPPPPADYPALPEHWYVLHTAQRKVTQFHVGPGACLTVLYDDGAMFSRRDAWSEWEPVKLPDEKKEEAK